MTESPSERAAFTPAPWDMHEDTANIGGHGQDVFAIESPTRPIAQIPAPASWDHAEYGEVKANARLMTAAPDLYAACEQALGVIVRSTLKGKEARNALAALADAINKARGEA